MHNKENNEILYGAQCGEAHHPRHGLAAGGVQNTSEVETGIIQLLKAKKIPAGYKKMVHVQVPTTGVNHFAHFVH